MLLQVYSGELFITDYTVEGVPSGELFITCYAVAGVQWRSIYNVAGVQWRVVYNRLCCFRCTVESCL
jgi:hypothetical protein